MKLLTYFLMTSLIVVGCKKNAKQRLSNYLETQQLLIPQNLIACAASQSVFSSNSTYPTDVFFYPIDGAYDFRYYECEKLKDSADFSKYYEKDIPSEPVFNGYLYKFRNTDFNSERMGIVTYRTEGSFHKSDPIRLKNNTKPTEFNSSEFQTSEDSTMPAFTWEDGTIKENVIYFQVISDTLGNLISGTYTIEKSFTFYDTSNVVLNITKGAPKLLQNSRYNVTLMGVSEDNWVNLIHERTFSTK